MLGVAARVPLRERVGVPVAGREAEREGDGLVGVADGVTGTHAPHVSPGNPGAPGVDATAAYPAAQLPE